MKLPSDFWLFSGNCNLVLIIFLSLLSKDSIEKLTFIHLLQFDKIGHFIIYCFTAFCYGLHFKINSIKFSYPLILVFFGLFLLGALMEILQYLFSHGRQIDFLDQLANTFGILSGLLLSSVVSKDKFRF